MLCYVTIKRNVSSPDVQTEICKLYQSYYQKWHRDVDFYASKQNDIPDKQITYLHILS